MAIIIVGRSLGVRLSSSLICDLAEKASVPAHVYTNCLAEEKVSLGKEGAILMIQVWVDCGVW
jgi:hypothetical protein